MDIDKHRAISYCGFKRCHDLLPPPVRSVAVPAAEEYEEERVYST